MSNAEEVRFSEVAKEAGIDISNISGSPEQGYISETMSAGVAALDADSDGFLDLFIIGGTTNNLTNPTGSQHLFINQQDGTFSDLTRKAGLYYEGWGMGSAVGDTDNDGDIDLYVTYLGINQFYLNNGDATFTEIGSFSGTADSSWGSSAAFGDLNNDGLLDLYVTNYVEFSFVDPPVGKLKCSYKGLESFCGPQGMKSTPDRLYQNLGNNIFEDVSKHTTISNYMLPALGVVLCDIDNDADLDIYIANDSERNLLFNNTGNWNFEEQAIEIGLAYSENGRAQAGMGIDAADYDEDGDIDFYVTNFSDDVNTLYQNQGNGTFVDNTYAAGLGSIIRPYLGWSTGFFDYDNDGDLDIFVANGHIYPQLNTINGGLTYPQANLLYRNDAGYYRNVEQPLGWEAKKVTRAAALLDYDNDGDQDILFVNLNEKPDLLRNDLPNTGNWVGIKLTGTKSNRDAIGARVTMVSNQTTRMREIQRGRGFQSQFDPRVVFGLQANEKIEKILVTWPSGLNQSFKNIPLKTYIEIEEGRATVIANRFEINYKTIPPPSKSSKNFTSNKSPSRPIQVSRSGWKASDYAKEGQRLYGQGRYKHARTTLEHANKLAPKNSAIQINLATVLFHGFGAYEKVIEILNKTINDSPNNSSAYLLLGKAQLRANRLVDATTTLQQAVARDSTNWEANNWLGVAYLRSKQPQIAVKFFTRATLIAPWRPTPHLHLSNVFSQLGNNEQALTAKKNFEHLKPLQEQVEQYQEKVKIFPDSSRAQTLLALAYVEQGQQSLAIRHFQIALQSDSTFSPAYHGLGRIYSLNGNMELAIINLEQACRWDQKYIPALIDLGKAYYKIRQWDRSIAIYSYVMTLQNSDTLVKTNLAMSYAMKGNIPTAKRFFSEAIQDDPKDISALDGMAQILESEGKKLDAKLLWEKILKIEPNHSRARIELQKRAKLK
ncbi:MAG: FG-GAP-like repeat-containing protein [Candidatus Latescibacterota bacterium]|nr:FG-GAP-like repeat-containing protein [Candidatus Latescibacterota bacterium]